jgi:hypothetical protein
LNRFGAVRRSPRQNRVVVALGERARRSNVSNEDLRSTEPVVDRKRVYRLYKPERLMVRH